MFKVLVALKSTNQFKCTIALGGKTKAISLPQTEGLTFRVEQLNAITIKYNEEVFKIQIDEDTTESTGEFKFTNISGQYYIVIIQDAEKPAKLNIKQNPQLNESPLSSRGMSASAKKFTFKTPTHRLRNESSQKLNQSFVLGDNLMEQIKQENMELKIKIIELENQIQVLQIQKTEPIVVEAQPSDIKTDFQNLLKLQQKQAKENKQLLTQLMDLDTNYQQLLEKKGQCDQEIIKLKQTISQFDCQITQLKSRLTQFEIDGLTQNIQLQLQVAQPIDSDNEVIDNLIKLIIKMRSTGSQYIPLKEDKLDTKLAQIIAKDHTQQYQFIRLKQGLYQIGDEQYQLSIQDNKVMINTEEGQIQIVDFIKNRKRIKSINIRKP